MISAMPKVEKHDVNLVQSFEKVKEIITSVRSIRKEKELGNKDELELKMNGEFDDTFSPIIKKMANVTEIEKIQEKLENAVSFMVGTTEFYVPMEDILDVEEEIKKLQEELDYTKGFLNAVMKKLDNEKFVQNAPEKVVNMEKKKKEDAESKIKTLEERINSLKNS
jgi:valyl-tRNA synthetase